MLYCKDSCQLLEDNEPNSIHAVVTDPPYGLNFLGLDWDRVLPNPKIWRACFQVLRPGGFCLIFGHTRLYHRLGCQIEDAGFVIKDCLCWGYASGFPKSLSIAKCLDKAARGCPQGVADPLSPNHGKFKTGCTDENRKGRGFGAGPGQFMLEQGVVERYKPETDEAVLWDGWGTALKTAWEPILMAQKPLEGTYIENVLKYNVGGLNIDDCRIPYKDEEDMKSIESFKHFEGKNHGDSEYFSANQGGKKQCNVHPDGRWPANLIWLDQLFVEYDHIFMIPKPSQSEKRLYNQHKTVKPVHLMERLIKLITPKPSVVGTSITVLDPFVGSGTTGVACKRLGREFIGYENNPDSFAIAQSRIREKASVDIFDR